MHSNYPLPGSWALGLPKLLGQVRQGKSLRFLALGKFWDFRQSGGTFFFVCLGMTKLVTPRPNLLARMQSPTWQDQLRASVCLYLELGARPSLAQEADALLQRTEAELLDYLLAGFPPTAAERQRAQQLLDMAQYALLNSQLQESLQPSSAHRLPCPN